VLEVGADTVGHKKEQIIPVAAFDAGLPGTAQTGVKFAGKESGWCDYPDGNRKRFQKRFYFRLQASRWIGISFQLDLYQLV